MKKLLLLFALIAIASLTYASDKTFWSSAEKKNGAKIIENKKNLTAYKLFALDMNSLKAELVGTPKRGTSIKSNVVLSFPDVDGTLKSFSIYESSNMEEGLAARYPEIKSYYGKGIDDATTIIYFSVSPLGLQTMQINADKPAVFIEPYTTDLSTYAVYRKSDKAAALDKFECKIINNARAIVNTGGGEALRPNADDATLRTFRLALSVTGEYTVYFGGTKALALAAMNNSLTRVNGVFEIDFGVHMNLIATTDQVIYTSASTDPYSAATAGAGGAWNQELQTTLTNVLGNSAYDIGHLFGASGGGGNAGCIGCVCVNPSTSVPLGKGSGFTSPADAIPSGDNFDIDYVAHEMGHQFGANHTFTHSAEGTGAQMEPGSGSTIMGYAGITSLDVQPHSDAYFHAESIQQVTNYIKTTTCQTNTATGNAVPTANAGLDFTIPKSTPFILTGAATDANGDALTYDWEEMDNGTTSAAPSATKTTGPNFRSYNPSTSPSRYFPKLSSTIANSTTTAGTALTVEALSSVARTLNFRLTVRDNHAGGPANNSDDMIVTVNATAGPFAVTIPNTAVSWAAGSTQTVTWSVAGTTANGVNAANVDILLSTDGGNTYPVTILAATANDGTEAITVPNNVSSTCRIMIKGSNHIFFDISNVNFTITASSGDVQAPTAPASLASSGTTQTTTNLSWTASTDNVAVTGYDVYKGAAVIATVTTTSYNVTGLTASTAYTFSVKAKDAAGNISAASNVVNVTTLAIADIQAPTAPTLSASATTQTTTTLSWSGATDNVAVTGYDVYQGATLIASVTTTTYNVTGLTAGTAYAFSVKAKDAAGNISAASNTVNVTTTTPDTQAPTAPASLNASGTTSSSTILSWTASTDNVAVTGYDVYQGATLKATVTATTYTVTGLTASTAYSFYVVSKDAAGSVSLASNTVTVTTLAASLTYCASQGTTVTDELIGRVQIGTINNPSTGGTGYTDFTAISSNVTQSTAYTITITPTWTSTAYAEGYAVFVDYNIDGDFADAGETVWTKAASTTTPVSGTFTIPATATLGATRMRVSLKYNGIPTSCETFPYGQVEDYMLNIQAIVVDTQAPTAPTSLVASGTTTTTTNLSWTASSDNVGVTGYDVYQGATLKATVTATTYAVTGLAASTAYTFSVKAKDAAGNVSASSNTVSVTTLAAAVTYCASQGNTVTDELIGRVQLGTINNASTGGTGYTNFTAISTNVVRSTAYTITVTPTWTSTAYPEGYAVFIDYNADGDFIDAGETVWTKAASTTTPVSGIFTIPTTATLGSTRMRVSLKYNGIPTSCETFSYGQVEDYTVVIASTAKAVFISKTETTGDDAVSLYPNPVTNGVLNISSIENNTDFKIVNQYGKEVINGKINNGAVSIASLPTGIYLIEIIGNDKVISKRFVKQ